MAVMKLADLLSVRESMMASNSLTSQITPMGSDLWGMTRFGTDPRGTSSGRPGGFVFGSSVWGVDSFGITPSPLAAQYGVTPEED